MNLHEFFPDRTKEQIICLEALLSCGQGEMYVNDKNQAVIFGRNKATKMIMIFDCSLDWVREYQTILDACKEIAKSFNAKTLATFCTSSAATKFLLRKGWSRWGKANTDYVTIEV